MIAYAKALHVSLDENGLNIPTLSEFATAVKDAASSHGTVPPRFEFQPKLEAADPLSIELRSLEQRRRVERNPILRHHDINYHIVSIELAE